MLVNKSGHASADHVLCTQIEASAGELQVAVGRARQNLDIAICLLYLCEQKDAPMEATNDSENHSSSSSNGEYEVLSRSTPDYSQLQQRINECLYNAAVADTLDQEQPELEARAAAIGKLREVLSRAACSGGSGLPLELEAQTLLLLGKLEMASGHGEAAVDTCATPGADT